MKGQQVAVDTIANNLANVNTVSYKSQSTQFKSLLYQTLQNQSTTANGDPKPTSVQVGLGTRVASTNTNFAQGAMTAVQSKSACAISGEGFFAITAANGSTIYTRSGDFVWALDAGGQRFLSNNNGEAVQDRTGQPIIMPDGVGVDSVGISTEGEVSYRDNTGNMVSTGQFIGLYQFANPTGLGKIGDSNYEATPASGEPIAESENPNLTPSEVIQGYLEASNVNVADEMVNLIVAQRAYEMNSKAITTSDSMLETANGLKR